MHAATRSAFWLLLLILALPARAGERVAALEAIPRSIAAAPGSDRGAIFADSGDVYLVVWAAGDVAQTDQYDIRAARVSRDGHLLDPLGFRIGVGQAGGKSVVWNGEYFLVTWLGTGGSLMRRIAADGTFLEAEPVRIEAGVGEPVWDGNRFFALSHAAGVVTGRFVDRELRAVGEPFVAIPPIAPITSPLFVRFDGYNFVIVFSAQFRPGIFASVISRSGERLLDWKPVASGSEPVLGGIGRHSIIAWNDMTDWRTMVAIVDGNADFVRGPVALPPPTGLGVRISDSRSGDAFAILVAGGGYPSVSYRSFVLSTQLAVLNQETITADVNFDDLLLEPDGSGTAVFSAMPPGFGFESVYFDQLGRDGTRVAESTRISRGPSFQVRPAIAFDGANFITAWLDRAGDSYDSIATFARTDRNGHSLDGIGKPLGGIGGYGIRGRVAIAARDGLSLVTWGGDQLYLDRRWIWGAKVAADGSVFDAGFVVASDACGTQIHSAASRTHFLTIHERCDDGDIHLVATPREGTSSSSQYIFGIADRHGYDVACGDDECLVAVSMNLPDVGWRVDTMRVTHDGIPIEPGRTAVGNCIAPTLASNGSDFLLACASVSGQQIVTSVIHDGIASALTAISPGGDPAYGPDAVWTGRDYAIVWQRLYVSPSRLLLRMVGADGTPLGESEEVVASALPAEALVPQHALASRGAGDLALVWSRHPLTLDVSSARLWMMLRERIDGRSRPVRR